MTFGLTNLALLFALAALAIPPIIHLLNRRRYVVVDWGAMQFLQFSQRTQRRVLWEDLLLMLVRMGLIGLLVLGLAGPQVGGRLVAQLGRSERDIVLVLDASASMSYDDGSGKTPFEAAKTWVRSFLGNLHPGTRVALLQAQQQVLPIVPELTTDLAFVEQKLAVLKPPAGTCRWPGATLEALRILVQSKSAQREIVLVGDDQRLGWADGDMLTGWEQVAAALKDMDVKPSITFVVGKLPSVRTNYSVGSLSAGRAAPWVGQLVHFKTSLKLDGFTGYRAPQRAFFEVDGKHAGDIPVPQQATTEKGQIPLSFSYRFDTAGMHLVSVILEPEQAIEKRSQGYERRDYFPADNRRDLVVEVLSRLPVLIVDGGTPGTAESGSFFVQKALGFSAAGTRAGVQARVVSAAEFDRDPDLSSARAIVLVDVPALSDRCQQALTRFIEAGGGAMVVLGPRAEQHRDSYNQLTWLPAKLERIQSHAGDVRLDRTHLVHPSLETFRNETDGLTQLKFSRSWKVNAVDRALVGASFTNAGPWLVEKKIGKGRVLLVTTPLDRAWGSDLPTRWEYPVLVHEFIYHIAKARSGEFNVDPGQAVHFTPEKAQTPIDVLLQLPDGEKKKLVVENWPLVLDTNQAGAYRIDIGKQPPLYAVAHPDSRESDMTPIGDEDRARLARILPVQYVDFSAPVADIGAETQTVNAWWLFFLAVVLLLCVEVWMTRRMAIARGAL